MEDLRLEGLPEFIDLLLKSESRSTPWNETKQYFTKLAPML